VFNNCEVDNTPQNTSSLVKLRRFMKPVKAQVHNLYLYVQNDPLTWIDPSGHQFVVGGNARQGVQAAARAGNTVRAGAAAQRVANVVSQANGVGFNYSPGATSGQQGGSSARLRATASVRLQSISARIRHIDQEAWETAIAGLQLGAATSALYTVTGLAMLPIGVVIALISAGAVVVAGSPAGNRVLVTVEATRDIHGGVRYSIFTSGLGVPRGVVRHSLQLRFAHQYSRLREGGWSRLSSDRSTTVGANGSISGSPGYGPLRDGGRLITGIAALRIQLRLVPVTGDLLLGANDPYPPAATISIPVSRRR